MGNIAFAYTYLRVLSRFYTTFVEILRAIHIYHL
jgi:hypothetical protein